MDPIYAPIDYKNQMQNNDGIDFVATNGSPLTVALISFSKMVS